jgi:hypothetical protein
MTGYIVTSLGSSFSYITEDKTEPLPGQPAVKGRLRNTVSLPGVAGALEADKGLKGLTKQNLKRSGAGGFASLLCTSSFRVSPSLAASPADPWTSSLAFAALWDWEARNGRLPTEEDAAAPAELKQAAEELLDSWGVSPAAIPDVADITQCVLPARAQLASAFSYPRPSDVFADTSPGSPHSSSRPHRLSSAACSLRTSCG